MIEWITGNIASIIISSVIFILAALAVYIIIRDKKQGKSGCSFGCENCPNRCNRENK